MNTTKFLGGVCGLAFLFALVGKLVADNKPSSVFLATFLIVGLVYLGIRTLIGALVD